ncbi:MAG TPA: mannose-1-phosphate guanylyltransferase/mannose-6-phosphate isomerase [Pseudomonadaceae bacterium]|nr:mannose-1-phosphate guanylyltransferase/mannose-6-phosphate isomerase [Pseudomonadaceae bacterium]
MTLLPVIICGGTGSRLWPVSRKAHPKPFIHLPDGESLLGKTYRRTVRLGNIAEVLTVTNQELFFKTEDEYSHYGVGSPVRSSYILEPSGRNTAAAVTAAALYARATYGNDAVLLILAADHLIRDEAAFAQTVQSAAELARQGLHATFGITPEHPETGFGYIEADTSAVLGQGFKVSQFVEKPNLERAQSYLQAGNYYWNSGMFCFQVGKLLEEMHLHAPSVLQATEVAMAKARASTSASAGQVLRLPAAEFGQVPDISIDYALMEHSSSTAVVPCDIGWSDIGAWTALSELIPEDAEGNRSHGEVIFSDARNNYIESPRRLTAALGVDDLIVVDTADALLVAHRDKAQDVKNIVCELQRRNHEAHLLHQTVYRPWGSYTTLEEGERFKIKRIEVKPGASLSLQMHHHRSEHWIVVSGMAKVNNDDSEYFLRANESTFILAGHKHRLANPGMTPLVLIEVQSGDYLGEDDIVRFEDNYGRACSH